MTLTFLDEREIKSKIFNGKKYTAYRRYTGDDKYNANKYAAKSRKDGWLVRVVPEKHGLNTRYYVYIRRST